MLRKATENLECAELLAESYIGHYDAAANRAYYAAYHAAWHFLARKGRKVPRTNDARYWRHSEITSDLENAGFSPDDKWDEDWDCLFSMRVMADYQVDSVPKSDSEWAVGWARGIVEWVKRNA